MPLSSTTPSHAGWRLADEQAFRAFALRAAMQAGEDETWVVAPFALLGWYREALTGAPPAGPVVCAEWHEVLATLENRLGAPQVPPARRTDLLASLVRALRTQPVPPGMTAATAVDPVGVAEALLPTVEAFLDHGRHQPLPPPEAGPRAFAHGNVALLTGLRDAVVADLAARGFATPSMRWAKALEALRAEPEVHLPRRLIVDGADTLDPLRLDLLAHLADCGVDVVTPPWLPLPWRAASAVVAQATPAPAAPVVVRHLRDLPDEAAFAVTWTRERLQAGAALGKLVVMVPADAGYEARLEGAFAEAGFPVSIGRHLPLHATEPFQALRAYARTRTGSVDMIDLVTMLRSTDALRGPVGVAIADHLYGKLPATWADVRAFLAAAGLPTDVFERVDSAIARLEDPGRSLPDELARFFDDWAPFADAGLRAACHDALAAYVDMVGARGGPADLPVAIERLGELAPRYLRPPGEVLTILTVGPYAPHAVSDLLVLGFTDGRFPSSHGHLPLLGASELALLAAAGGRFPTPAQRAAFEMRNIWRLLGLATHVTVAVPERGAAGEGLRPSPVLELVETAAHVPVAAGAPTPPEHRLAVATSLRAGVVTPEALALAKHEDGAWIAACFDPPRIDQHPADAIARLMRPLSPSALDKLLACPFTFHASALLRLEERPPARALAWDPATAGSVAHKALELMLETTADVDLRAEDVGPALMRALAEDFPGLAPAAHRLGIEALRKDLEHFVARYAALAAELGVVGGHSEWWFSGAEMRFPVGDGENAIPVRGVVDRVWLRGDAPPIAIDFKSGDVAKFKAQRAAGLGAQVALYSWAIREKGVGDPAAFAYLTLTGRRVEMDAVLAEGADVSPLRPGATTGETLEGVQATFRAAIGAALGRVAAGLIEPVTAERADKLGAAKAHPCTYCVHDLLCRSKQEASR